MEQGCWIIPNPRKILYFVLPLRLYPCFLFNSVGPRMTRRYAEDTSVSIMKTKVEIETFLMKKGATGFSILNEEGFAAIAFRLKERWIRFKLLLPKTDERRFFYNSGRNKYNPKTNEAAYASWEQECRSKWRALYLGIKAKLELVDSGILSFEEEFAAQTVMPDGQTLFEFMEPQVKLAYEKGTMPKTMQLGFNGGK